jgi:hypothetical protein
MRKIILRFPFAGRVSLKAKRPSGFDVAGFKEEPDSGISLIDGF